MARSTTIALAFCLLLAIIGSGCRDYKRLEGRTYSKRLTPGWYGDNYPLENRGRGLSDWAYKESRIPPHCPQYCKELCIACETYRRESDRENLTQYTIAQGVTQQRVDRAFGGCPCPK